MYVYTADVSWKRAFHDICALVQTATAARRQRATATTVARRRSRSCGESRDGGGRGCRVAASPVHLDRSVVVIIALETCRLYLPVKRITRALVAFHVPTRLFISEVYARGISLSHEAVTAAGEEGGTEYPRKPGKKRGL